MWIQTLNVVIFVFGVFLGVYHGVRLALFKKNQSVHLEQFATRAVRQVEQQNGTMSGPAKKQLALASVTTQFKDFKLPMLPPDSVDIAIESAVFLLPKNG